MPDPRLFIGIYPAGIEYADRTLEQHGDYKHLAFLDYATLSLSVERSCPSDLRARIVADAASVQARRGQQFPISACGQTVLLGSALPKEEEPSSGL